MSVTEHIAPHLPYLRRFARALTGNQSSGDAYVASLLEVLAEDPSFLPKEGDPRVCLYKAFARIWNSLSVNSREESPGRHPQTSPVDEMIDIMTPLPRQAFLLHSVENFDAREVAEILDLPVSEVLTLIDEAGQEIARVIATDALIIEDEPMIAFDLEGIVESLGHQVMAIARTKSGAVEACKKKAPGLILADIELADNGSGIDAVDEILEHIEVPVIFITAYPERLLTGKRPEPTYLITKPYRPETVKAIISQSLFFKENAHRLERKGDAAARATRD